MTSVMDQLREAIRNSDETPYAIGRGSGVHKSQLSRMLNHERSLGIESAERLADYLGLEIIIRPKRRNRKAAK
jgi:plasmid maintenance system antidote protein VapI